MVEDIRFSRSEGVRLDCHVTIVKFDEILCDNKRCLTTLDGKFVYRGNEFQGIRIGSGGPEYKFENFNGDIRIRNRGQ